MILLWKWQIASTYFDPSTKEGAILLGIVSSILLIGLQKILKWMQLLVNNFLIIRVNSSYSLSGYWFSQEIENNELSIININKVIQGKRKVQFHVWQYSNQPTGQQFKRYYSEGIMKGNHLSSYFYSGENLPETGAFICKQEGQKLIGRYIQYSVDEDNANLVVSPENYYLKRIELPLASKLKMFFGHAPFKTRDEAFNYIKSENNKIKWRKPLKAGM